MQPATQTRPRSRSRSTPRPAVAGYVPATDTADDLREQLIREHVGLVYHVARKLVANLNRQADLDEMVSAGMVGLMQAVEGFDVSRGLSFSTFAVPRIRGSILDELRKLDRVPRSVRHKSREMNGARERLSASLGRTPTQNEMSAELGITAVELRGWEMDLERGVHVPLDAPRERNGESRAAAIDTIADDAPSIDELITREEDVASLREAIGTLRDQEQTVLALYYFEELKLQEIAEMLGLSACRISQIRTAAIDKLRGRMTVAIAA